MSGVSELLRVRVDFSPLGTYSQFTKSGKNTDFQALTSSIKVACLLSNACTTSGNGSIIRARS